jgi:hypothetical protein
MRTIGISIATILLVGGMTAATAQNTTVPKPDGSDTKNLPAKPAPSTAPAKAGVGSRPFGTENLPAKPEPPAFPKDGTSPDLPAKPNK